MSAYKIVTSNKFLKDLKLLKKRSRKDFSLLHETVSILAEHGHAGLSKKHNTHKLKGNYSGYWNAILNQIYY